MSLEIYLNNPINKDDIISNTNINVIGNNIVGIKLTDEFNNAAFANQNPIDTIIFYGLTNPLKILDELVKNLNVKFVDSETFEEQLNIDKNKNIDLYKMSMTKYNFTINSVGNYNIPNRNEKDYL